MALTHFKEIVFMSNITILTDHKNLTYNTNVETNRWQRWNLILEEYNLKWEYKPRKANVIADELSRMYFLAEGTRKEITNEQETKLIKLVHDKLCHPGINTIYNTLKRDYKIGHLKEKIQELLTRCEKCQIYKKTSHKYGLISGSISTSEPFKHISSDIYGPVETFQFETADENSKFYILTITDRCTRWSEAYMIKEISAKETIKAFERWEKNNSRPYTVLTDQGRNYTSREFCEYLKEKAIRNSTTTPYNPTGNSISERINQTITRVMQTHKGERLREVIKKINYVLQNQYHSRLACSPQEFRTGKSSMVGGECARSTTLEINNKGKAQSMRDLIKINRGRKPYEYQIGEKIYVKNLRTNKLDPYWRGPEKIRRILRDQNVLETEGGRHIRKNNIKNCRPL